MRSEESNLFEKRRSISDADRWQLTVIFTVGWAVLTLVLFSLVLVMDYRRFENDFNDLSQRIKDRLDARIAKNEAVLEGFASFLAGMQHYDEAQLTQYAKRIVERFPHVFMLEVATRASASDLDSLIQRQRRLGYAQFRIKSFDYRDTREWRDPPEAEFYYPLTFIYPLPEESRPVLGLDLSSDAGMGPPLQRALRTGSYQTSLPVKLIEGNDAYVMFMPVRPMQDETATHPDGRGEFRPLQIVLIVLLQERLLMQIQKMLPESLGLLIYHSDKPSDDPSGWLFNKPAVDQGLFSSLIREYKLEPAREGFMLRLERSFGVDAISVDMLFYAAIASALIFFFSRHFILYRYQREIDRSRREARLELLASYDPLTQLPNRNRLQEWLQELARDEAENVSYTAILMDLEGLRAVNDRYGHAAGDHVLEEVAKRIRRAVDKDDRVARIGGDEFVALLKRVRDDDALSEIVERLTRGIQEPIRYAEDEITMKVSVGVAFYPDGANRPEELIQLADKVMYQSKRTRERWVTG